jgi:hypothetical protein
MATSAPCPSQSPLLRRIRTRSSSGVSTRSATSSAHSSERWNAPAKPEASSARSRLPIMLAGHKASMWPITSAVAGALPCLAAPMVRGIPRRTALTPPGWSAARDRRACGGGPPADDGRLAALIGEPGEVGGDDADMRRQGCGAPGAAPGGEVAPVAGVGRPRRQGLLYFDEAHGTVDLGHGDAVHMCLRYGLRPTVRAVPSVRPGSVSWSRGK